MPNLPRVAITGIGAICGLGQKTDTIWSALLSGHSGICELNSINTTGLPINIGGEIKNFTVSDDLISPKDKDRYDRFIHLSMHASAEAIQQSGLNSQTYSPEKIGCIVGTGIGGFNSLEDTIQNIVEKQAIRVSPFFIPGFIPNMASALISMKYQFLGTNYAVASACASSNHSIGLAYNDIQLGRLDACIAGGSEAALTRLGIIGFSSMKALSKGLKGAQKASRPFDRDRDGFVLSEGAAFLVLENLEKAKKRGANILAEIVGFGASSDAYHISSPRPDGEGAAKCMQMAIENAGISADQIGHINAHGTSTIQGDIAETTAIKKTFGSHAHQLKICSTKSSTGHLLGAAGALESIFTVLALKNKIIPPTINLDSPDPQCDLDYTPHSPVEFGADYALNNSFGFGGTNASLIFKKYPS